MSDLQPPGDAGGLISWALGILGALGTAALAIFGFGRKTGFSASAHADTAKRAKAAHERLDELEEQVFMKIGAVETSFNTFKASTFDAIEAHRKETNATMRSIHRQIVTILRESPRRDDIMALKESMDRLATENGQLAQQNQQLSLRLAKLER